jgi:hypothetical protein
MHAAGVHWRIAAAHGALRCDGRHPPRWRFNHMLMFTPTCPERPGIQ